jgi:hypothetical protein
MIVKCVCRITCCFPERKIKRTCTGLIGDQNKLFEVFVVVSFSLFGFIICVVLFAVLYYQGTSSIFIFWLKRNQCVCRDHFVKSWTVLHDTGTTEASETSLLQEKTSLLRITAPSEISKYLSKDEGNFTILVPTPCSCAYLYAWSPYPICRILKKWNPIPTGSWQA